MKVTRGLTVSEDGDDYGEDDDDDDDGGGCGDEDV